MPGNDVSEAASEFERYLAMAIDGGATTAKLIPPAEVTTAEWVRLRCQYGCSVYGRCLTCPPHSPTPEQTRKVLDEFSVALLLHSHGQADLRVLAADIEREAFLDGHYKALSYHAGPCGLCGECDTTSPCEHPTRARPAMEAAGIDVFATARAAGMPIEVVRERGDEGDSYALVLIE